jgi:hypothetical protein
VRRRPGGAYASDLRPPVHRHPEQDRRMPPGAAGAQSRPHVERATDILWFDFGHRSWRRRAALVLGRRIALAYRASLGGASQVTSTALQIARIFDHVTWCGFGVIQVASMRSWSTADLNLVGHNEIRSAMSAHSRRRATSIACATSAKRRRSGCILRHRHHPAARARPAAAMTGLDGYRK